LTVPQDRHHGGNRVVVPGVSRKRGHADIDLGLIEREVESWSRRQVDTRVRGAHGIEENNAVLTGIRNSAS
jgi:hypothetical protein